MMNAYQVSGNTNDCVNYLSALKANPTPIIRDFCMRDLNALLAYSMYRNGQRFEGEALIEETLKMPLYNPTPERVFRDYSYGAAIIYGKQHKQHQAIVWYMAAITEAESCKAMVS